MPKQLVEATELTDGDVRYVSLVSRGANRIPFRLTKSEDGTMSWDLSTLFRKAEAKPIVTGIAFARPTFKAEEAQIEQDVLDAQKMLVSMLGLRVDQTEQTDTYTVFKQAPGSEDSIAYKLDEGVFLTVAHAKKGFMNLGVDVNEGNGFAAQNFCPSVWNGIDMLQGMIWDCMGDGTSSDDAASAIEKVCDDFKDYMSNVVRMIPQTAWKTEQEYRRLQKREFSADERKHLASTGAAMPDGSFPILNQKDLENAISLAGNSKEPGEVKSHIISRAHKLGLVDKLPKSWAVKDEGDIGGQIVTEKTETQKAEGDDTIVEIDPALMAAAAVFCKSIVDQKLTAAVLRTLAKDDSGEVAGYISSITGQKVDDIVTVLGRNDPGGKLAAAPNPQMSSDYPSGIGGNSDESGGPLNTDPTIPDESTIFKSALEKITGAVAGLVDQVKGVAEQITKFDERLGAVETTANGAAESAKKSAEVMGTVIVNDTPAGDNVTPIHSRKAASAGAPPLLDTAYDRVS